MASVVPITTSMPMRSFRPSSGEANVSLKSHRVRFLSSFMEYALSPPYQPSLSGKLGRHWAGGKATVYFPVQEGEHAESPTLKNRKISQNNFFVIINALSCTGVV